MSRIWGGGRGGQCTRARELGDEYCMQHRNELTRQQYLTHGRIDGAIPPKKLKEFEKWQKILVSREKRKSPDASNLSAPARGCQQKLADSASFAEVDWRALGRGQGESDRAYAFRTGKQ